MGKNIVVCCDGTWNDPTSKTNVHALFNELIKKEDKQCVMYIKGVGTGYLSLLKPVIDGSVATGLDDKVKEAYKFIVNNYQPEDNIWLFGFSRGAYTVRSVVGLIRNCGIVKFKDDQIIDQIIDLAYNIYRNRNPNFNLDGSVTKGFKKGLSHPDSKDPPIKFLGLFDTVGAHGLPGFTPGKGFEYLEFYDKVVPNVVKYACQALAAHERRSFFEPCRILPNNHKTVIKETWFPGVHSEVGGGASENNRITKASMLWMLENIAEVKGLLMKDTIEGYRSRFNPSSGDVLSRSLFDFFSLTYALEVFSNRDRVIEIEVDSKISKTLKRDLLYKDGDWHIFSTRNSLKYLYGSNTYENLRISMKKRGIKLHNGVEYEEPETVNDE
ncbi:hypothetical protein C1645_834325 [Glomus cerebriforme]|uniref:T6SS Phospholipase effector Tle1-like catalytic domain-containing protein n=1 Tax=Glomus cerebriforme TaxID=658196 RepID=A0A397SDZ7_9GLOM|nr:hypothetical protein C1645_834325 [Glomus cerebriforme]